MEIIQIINAMTKYTLALILWLCTLTLGAQQTFTDKLQQVVESAGRIILHQEKSITDLVNGSRKSSTSRQKQVDELADSIAAADSLSQVVRYRTTGYRIQVYFGDNSRKGKAEARAAGLRFRNYFPGERVYVSFVSPHWLCRVGDFQTMGEAREILSQIRSMGIFREAVIVKSKVNPPKNQEWKNNTSTN